MMNVLISIGNRVTDIFVEEFLVDIFKGCCCLSAVFQGKRDVSDAHWLAPKVVSTAEVIL